MVVGQSVSFIKDQKLHTGCCNALLGNKIIEVRIDKQLFHIFKEEVIEGRFIALSDSMVYDIQHEYDKTARKRDVNHGAPAEKIFEASLSTMDFVLNKVNCSHLFKKP